MAQNLEDVVLVFHKPDIRAGTFRGREAVGRWVHGRVVWLYRLRDGRVIRTDGYETREEALEDAGSPE